MRLEKKAVDNSGIVLEALDYHCNTNVLKASLAMEALRLSVFLASAMVGLILYKQPVTCGLMEWCL